LLVTKDDNNCGELGPDYVRLKNRYEVTNGVHEINPLSMTMRSMSYAMTIGQYGDVQKIVDEHNWPIELQKWYNQPIIIQAMCEKY